MRRPVLVPPPKPVRLDGGRCAADVRAHSAHRAFRCVRGGPDGSRVHPGPEAREPVGVVRGAGGPAAGAPQDAGAGGGGVPGSAAQEPGEDVPGPPRPVHGEVVRVLRRGTSVTHDVVPVRVHQVQIGVRRLALEKETKVRVEVHKYGKMWTRTMETRN